MTSVSIKGMKFWYFALALSLINLIIYFFIGNGILYDELEHIQISYYVSQGEIPYRDFFEHHHPLIWYVFAPIITILNNDTILTLYVARSLIAIISTITVFIIYQIIKKFFGGVINSLYAFVFYTSSLVSLTMYSTFKPDAFMYLFYFAGLYYFFNYIENKKIKHLVFCGFCFTMSFIALQTALFLIIPIGFTALWMIYENPKLLNDYIKASIPSICILVFLVTLLIKFGLWKDYYELNWIYNKEFFNFINYNKSIPLFYFGFYFIGVFIAYFYLIKKVSKDKRIYLNTIFIQVFFLLLKYILYIPVHPQYMMPLLLFSSILLGSAYAYLPDTIKLCSKVYILLSLAINILFVWINQLNYIKVINTIENDSAISYHYNFLPVSYNKHSRYCFLAPEICVVDELLFNRQSNYKLQDFINNNKIKYIIYLKNDIDLSEALKNDKNNIDIWNNYKFDATILKDYTEIYPNLYKRKE